MHLMQPSNHRLKRELKVRDLVLMQILVIVSLNLSGYAAKQGRSQVVLWLLAIALFYLPQAAVVFGCRSTEWRPGFALRLAAFLALLVAALAFVLQLLPVGEVASPWLFAMKVTGAICATSGIGAYLYWRGSLRAQSKSLSEVSG